MTIEMSPVTKTTAEMTALYEGLGTLIQECGPEVNKHDLAAVLISACIDRGIDTQGQIIGVLQKLNFHRGHVAAILKAWNGSDRSHHRWKRNEHGVYININ